MNNFLKAMHHHSARSWKAAAVAAFLVMMSANAWAGLTITYKATKDLKDAIKASIGEKLVDNPTYDEGTQTGTVTLLDDVTEIPANAFQAWDNPDLKSLTSVIIPNGVTSIGESAFKYCSSLASIEIPEGVTSIGEDAFGYCSSLTSIEIPEGVKSIEALTFQDCTSLSEVSLPSTITSVGFYAFDETPIVAGASDDMVYLNLAGGGYVALRYTGNASSMTIKEGTKILAGGAFCGCTSLTSITIPEGVTSIGATAFSSCTSLVSINIPSSVTSIKDYVFQDCSSLTSIEIPESVTSIGEYAFENCEVLSSIIIPSKVTSIGNYAFGGCTSLTSVTYLGKKNPGSGVAAFDGNDNVKEVNVPFDYGDGKFCELPVKKAAASTFYYTIHDKKKPFPNKNLKRLGTLVEGTNKWDATKECYVVEYSTKVTTIVNNVFNDTRLISIDIPSSVTSIGDSAFYSCKDLKSIEIPSSVTSIGNNAFAGCIALSPITIPASVSSIGNNAFYYCEALDTVKYLGMSNPGENVKAFEYCDKLSYVNVPTGYVGEKFCELPVKLPGVFYYKTNDGKPIADDKWEYLGTLVDGTNKWDATKGCYVVEYSGEVTSISRNAFYYCETLTSITIPKGVTSIGSYAFALCEALTSIDIPDGVTSIEETAFAWCEALTSVTIPEGVTNIGTSAFFGCTALSSITIPSSVTSIGDYAFKNSSALTTVKYLGTSNPEHGDNVFEGCSVQKVNVPTDYDGDKFCELPVKRPIVLTYTATENLTDAIKASFGDKLADATYSNGTGKITLKDDVTEIPVNAFNGCTALTSVTIPEGVINIGDHAFFCCTALEKVEYLGKKDPGEAIIAFDGCDKLSYVDVPADYDGTTFCGKEVRRPTLSAEITYTTTDGASLKALFDKIGTCTEIKNERTGVFTVKMPAGLDAIPFLAFNDCTTLASITLPKGMKSIEAYAFYGCTSLAKVSMPEGMTDLKEGAFWGCTLLDNVTIPGSVKSVWASVFRDCAALKSIAISAGVEAIGASAFQGCTSLDAITIPKGVTRVGDMAFYGCTALASAAMPSTITSVGTLAFQGTKMLDECAGVLYLGKDGYIAAGYDGSASVVEINDGARIMADGLFAGCKTLTDAIIPASVEYVGSYAFASSPALAKVIYLGMKDPKHGDDVFLSGNIELVDVLSGYNGDTFCELGVRKSDDPTSIISRTADGSDIFFDLYGNRASSNTKGVVLRQDGKKIPKK